ncbi:diaminopimelate epimerase [Tissierella sp.]|uniref:diaminopimelate epimerase n=1 Tax=Tissierella sp. TaxID=41274 RepID=UPI00285B3072|nr:diaminopimelate epimerase [Tissierella sp.]MDR7856682.1 diaminopimelate epimerase [Tissierella sp.]
MKFDKLVAAGNDFIIFNAMEKTMEDYSELALKVCDRHFGIGADGIMVCENSLVADIKMIYYNSDGTQGEMCGNGIRCFSKYIYDYDIVDKDNISIETLAGIKYVDIETNENHKVQLIKVDMGYPIFEGKKIPVDLDKENIIGESIEIDNKTYEYSALLVGVPHVVIFLQDVSEIDINDLGKKIENHFLFPKKTNVNFIEVIDFNNINIYTWERGAGRTLGCGTGSCASVVIGNILNKLDKKVQVNTEGGSLTVELNEDYRIYMTGSATHIAGGELLI